MTPDLSAATIYTNFQGLDSLKLAARDHSSGAVKAVAKQFEALFIQMMLKSMRDASGSDPLLNDQQMKMYQDMYDKQLALNVSENGKGIGLADMLVKQLQSLPQFRDGQNQVSGSPHGSSVRKIHGQPVAHAAVGNSTIAATSDSGSTSTGDNGIGASPEAFVRKLWPLAKRAAQKIGTSAEALIAQAALETGWGKSVIRRPDGTSSHNLFNIKADDRWHGDTVAKQTVEYSHGMATKEVAQFRSYGSYAESFDDYVSFLQSNPRYQRALDVAADPKRFVQSLQQAGYATDPEYANKIKEIMGRPVLVAANSPLKHTTDGTLT